jgi:cell shape-determining protein MreD
MKTLTYLFDRFFTSPKTDRASQIILAVVVIYFLAQIGMAIISKM